MNSALWVLQAVGALAFLLTGSMKLVLSREKLREKVGWVADLPPVQVKLIGLAEFFGALGLVLPQLLGIFPILGAIAAAALFLLMLGAVASHLARKEAAKSAPALFLALLVALIAIGRFFILPA